MTAPPPFPSIGTAVRDRAVSVRNALAGVGIPTSLQPGDVQTPGGWLTLRTLDLSTLGETWTARFYLYLIAPDVEYLQALDILGGLLDRALRLVAPDEAIDTATSVQLRAGEPALPAYRLTIDELIDP